MRRDVQTNGETLPLNVNGAVKSLYQRNPGHYFVVKNVESHILPRVDGRLSGERASATLREGKKAY